MKHRVKVSTEPGPGGVPDRNYFNKRTWILVTFGLSQHLVGDQNMQAGFLKTKLLAIWYLHAYKIRGKRITWIIAEQYFFLSIYELVTVHEERLKSQFIRRLLCKLDHKKQ